ncbi:hypothetical protein [Azospira restricta]|uniref:Uncharacterized protein n=1 Tax=Azospira restricta TaxID=404405 RepID=A0A974PWB2_9RHOO|nr:hypothetical protein [Azospira restricta]QRJ62283.1 hypothetical protein IWH25_10790 [Azospira restricta]
MIARAAALLLAIALAAPARAEPPPGHPSPAKAVELLAPQAAPAASELPHRGTVLSAINVNEYTYLEVAADGGSRWLAAPRLDVAAGATIRYADGATMANFYSKVLQRTFPSLTFVRHVAVLPD